MSEETLKLDIKVDEQKMVASIVSGLAEKGFYAIAPKMLTREEASKFMGYSKDTFDKVKTKPRFPKPMNSKYSNLAIIEWMRDINNFQQ